jgi:hypothetical protein
MPTNAQLKTLVNTDIRSKTLPNSILKGKVADTIDAAYDYTDQEVSTLEDNVAQYFEDNIFGAYGSFTDESLTAPYPFFNNRVNYLLASGTGKVALPETNLVGLQIIVITAFAKTIHPLPDGTGVFLAADSSSGASFFNMLVNKTYKFTYLGEHLGNPTWAIELMGL